MNEINQIDIYTKYHEYVKNIISDGNITNFKSNNIYKDMLEHVNFDLGKEYYRYILNTNVITLNNIKEFVQLNDKFGNPDIYDYENLKCSPSSLRYIFHSYLILSYMKKLNKNEINIVEIGGGYGGLCLAIIFFSDIFNIKINNYHIIDLTYVIELQKMYLSQHNINNINNITYHNFETFGRNIMDTELFLISNYCFSEINEINQKKYIDNLFNKLTNGFMCWNAIEVYDFRFTPLKI